MPANSSPHLVKKLIALVGLTSLSALISFPGTAQMEANSSVLNNSSNTRTQSLTAKQGINLIAQAVVRNNIPVELETSGDAFTVLSIALKVTGLNQTLSQRGPFTIFAPTDEAFANLPEGTVQSLLQPENREALVKLLSYHVVRGKVTSVGNRSGSVGTLANAPVRLQVNGNRGTFRVNTAQVILSDIPARNGVIQGINQVLLPPNP